jgi:hypothetical protein
MSMRINDRIGFLTQFFYPGPAPGIRADAAFDYHAGIGRNKMHAVAALLIAFRLILILRLRLGHLARLGLTQT